LAHFSILSETHSAKSSTDTLFDFMGDHLLENQQTNVELEGDMNPFIKAMAEKPLRELVNTMSSKLAALSV